MKKTVLLNLLFLLFLISCGNDSGNSAENSEKIINTTISGMAQGPFEKGATVSVYELDTNFQQTGYNIETSIKSDKGDFSVKLRDFESQYILFKVEGYYFNIFTNKKIKDKLTLYALTDLSERDKVNINLLTHLAYNRTQYLVSEKNVPIKKAKKQAESEVLKAFGIEEDDFNDAEDLDFFGKDKQSAALLAISVLMQGNILDANLNDRLTDFVSDIEKDGTWDNKQIKTEIANWASILSQYSAFDKVKGYIEKWNQTVNFSAFEKYVENFWQQNYNLDSIDFSKTNIKCELDTLNWKDTTEGATRKGDITDIIYIYDNKKWRVATLPEASLGGCNEKSVGNFGYVEERKMQDKIEPRINECIIQTQSSECGDPVYHPGYYICIETYGNKFHWDGIDSVSFFKTICNHSNDSANSNNDKAHWGSVIPVKKKCANCKQKDIDLFEDRCNKRCYFGTMVHASACALGWGGCTKDLYGTMKEGPAIKTGRNSDYVGYESYVYDSYLISIDSTKKATYICRNQYTYEEPNEPSYGWYVASDFDIDAAPTICTWDLEDLGLIVVGKKNKYVCEDESFRLATQEEIEEGIACTEYNMYDLEKCGSELEKQTGMTCAEYMRLVEKCRAKRKE